MYTPLDRLPRSVRVRAVILRALIGLLYLGWLSGCGGDSPTEPREAVLGAWSLESINGQPLPSAVTVGPDASRRVTAGSLYMTEDRYGGHFNLRLFDAQSADALVYYQDGFWGMDGSRLVFQYANAVVYADAVVSGNTLTVSTLGSALMFTKQ